MQSLDYIYIDMSFISVIYHPNLLYIYYIIFSLPINKK